MYKSLEIFQAANAMARHAGASQAIVARNIANADTPGYAAQRIAPFSKTYATGGTITPLATRAGHLTSATNAPAIHRDSAGTEPSPNGNTVSIEEELLNSVAISHDHDRALAVYRHAMTVLRMTLGR